MTAPVTAVATETQQIEEALDALLTAITDADRVQGLLPDAAPTPAGILVIAYLDRLATWTKAQRAADELLKRPVSWALRKAVRTLGERLHEIGGQQLMQEACHRAASRDPANEGRRLGIIDHRWDGIGDWFA